LKIVSGLEQRRQRLGVGAVGDQHADLPPGEIARPALDDA
jgi:hypothetical protein